MNITLKNIDPVNAIIKIDIAQADYAEETEKTLKNLRQNAFIPGFRKGMVSMGYIKKMYEKSVISEQVNKIVSKELYSYIRENKLNMLGEPLPCETEQKIIDLDKDVNFEFCFDIALAPVFEVKLTKRDRLPYYSVEVSDEMLNNQIESLKANYGTYIQGEQIEDKDMVKGLLTELNENGEEWDTGIEISGSVFIPSFMKDEEEKNKFIGAKVGDIITFVPYKAYEGNSVELASFLQISQEIVDEFQDINFSFEIKEISRYIEAELNQDLFDKVFGEGTVTAEEEFKDKVKEMLALQTKPDSDYKFLQDARKLLERKTSDMIFPEAFLKRWLLVSDEKRTPETLEQEFPKIVEDLKFHLFKEQIIKNNDFKVEEEDLNEVAKTVVRVRFAHYGMTDIPEDMLENYAKEMLKKEENVRNLVDRVLENKLIEWLKGTIALQKKEVTVDEFHKLIS